MGFGQEICGPDRNMTPENLDWLIKIMDEMYTLAVGQVAIEYEDKISLLKQIPKYEAKQDFEKKLSSFAKMLQSRGITGNEALITMFKFNDLGYLAEDVVETVLWDESSKEPRRAIALQRETKEQNQVYIMDLNELGIQKKSLDEMNQMIASGYYRYEDNKYQLVRN